MGDPAFAAVVIEALPAFHAETRLQRSGRIVDPGMDDAAVVRARFRAEARVKVEEGDEAIVARASERARKTGDTAADDQDVDVCHRRVSWLSVPGVV
jgi:hypothetical protein